MKEHKLKNDILADRIATDAGIQAYDCLFNIQTIIALLMEKGIFTLEEFTKSKEVVIKNSLNNKSIEMYSFLRKHLNDLYDLDDDKSV